MKRIISNTDILGAESKQNIEAYRIVETEFKKRLIQVVARNDDDKAVIKHRQRGKILARERIERLIDSDSPFLELSIFAAWGQYNDSFPSAGIITGVGKVHGKWTTIIANDATIKGGTYIKETIKKHLRALEIALKNCLPTIYLVDSGGVFLPEHTHVFPDKEHFGRIFYLQSQMSAHSIPQVAVVMGSCTAGGAYIPAMADESIIVKGEGTIFLGGPPLVKAATGETVTAEELGGGFVHTSISGVADHLAENDDDAIDICRNIFENIQQPKGEQTELFPPEKPFYNTDEIYSLIPANSRHSIDAKEILARIVDRSEFQEFKAEYGKTLITGFARIEGIIVGIIANNGILFSESALKGTHFIELCNFRRIPILFIQNITGFMVGKDAEHGGIAKDGAKMVHAVSTASVPKITLITGASYGAGNYAMAGRAFDLDFLFMWPSAHIGVMGGEQAGEVLTQIKAGQEKALGKEINAQKLDKLKQTITEQYNNESSAYYSSSRIWDDGIILPHETRNVIAIALRITLNRKFGEIKAGVYRM